MQVIGCWPQIKNPETANPDKNPDENPGRHTTNDITLR